MTEYFGLIFEFDHAEVHRIINEHITNHEPGYVCQIDGVNFSFARNNPEHAEILNHATVNCCDSAWLPKMINRIYGTHYSNYAGSDIFMHYVEQKKYRQFFLGSTRRILDGLKNEISRIDPAARSMRFEELPFMSADEFDYEGIADMINRDKPDIIWVSLGAPKQEAFMNRLLPHLKKGVMFGIGAVFNFYSGLEDVPKRASPVMIKLNLEWLDRIFREPQKQIYRCAMIIRTFFKAYISEKRNHTITSKG